ncbi:hypothetical protein [Dactylosporangium sp. CS-033363]|uniref:hypothetical protein n=1 Tax=Dactylosporangium sp. CS-033363 TaxID=3239935 RepID=UPI003D8E2F21
MKPYTAPTLSDTSPVKKADIEPGMRVLEQHDAGARVKLYRVSQTSDLTTSTTPTLLGGMALDLVTRGKNALLWVSAVVDFNGAPSGSNFFNARAQLRVDGSQFGAECLFQFSKSDRSTVQRTWLVPLTFSPTQVTLELWAYRDNASGAFAAVQAQNTGMTVLAVDMP